MNFKTLIVGCLIMFLSACSTPVSHYANQTPTLNLEHFFDGKLEAQGIVKDYRGRVIRRFNARITASWQAGIGTLDENFIFDDGDTQKRIWTLVDTGTTDSHGDTVRIYNASASDVIGKTAAKVSGNALFMQYILQVPYKNGTLNVRVDDKMYLVNDQIIINESKLYKWGIPVGAVILTITKHDRH